MSAKFNFATGDVLKFVQAIKEQHHPTLRNNRIIVLWREDAEFGHMALAQVIPPVFRFLTQTDAILYVHKGAWENNLNESQKAYWIDHALCMIGDSDKFMNDGRPKLFTVQPERIGFSRAIQRHGMVTDELKRVRTAVMESSGQINIFDLLQEVNSTQFGYSGYNADDVAAAAGKEALEVVLSEPDNELFVKAARLILETRQATVSLLQRRMKIGYYAAAILMDKLERAEFVGPFEGSAPRKILLTEEQLAFYEESAQEEEEVAAEVAATVEQTNDGEQEHDGPPVTDIFHVDNPEPPQPGLEA